MKFTPNQCQCLPRSFTKNVNNMVIQEQYMKLAIKIVFIWKKDRIVTGRSVSIILSDADSHIELLSDDDNPDRYESEFVSILPGKYTGQIIFGNDIHPVDDVSINLDTTHVEVKIKNDADDCQLIISKKEPSQTHLNGHKENNTVIALQKKY